MMSRVACFRVGLKPLCQSGSSHTLKISGCFGFFFKVPFLHKSVFARIDVYIKCKDLLAAESSLPPCYSSSVTANLSLEPRVQKLMVF